MEDYFNDAPTETIPTYENTQQQQPDHDQFQFADTGNNNQISFDTQLQYQMPSTIQEDQIMKRVREEEDRINEQLRKKANKQYEDKQARKERGRKELQQFFEKKQREKQQRKKNNLQEQEAAKEKKSKNLAEQSSWAKVAANIKLKQGEYVGNKDVNRMRQAIIHKRDDQKQ